MLRVADSVTDCVWPLDLEVTQYMKSTYLSLISG
jgi:hypothetical protein